LFKDFEGTFFMKNIQDPDLEEKRGKKRGKRGKEKEGGRAAARVGPQVGNQAKSKGQRWV